MDLEDLCHYYGFPQWLLHVAGHDAATAAITLVRLFIAALRRAELNDGLEGLKSWLQSVIAAFKCKPMINDGHPPPSPLLPTL